jgi:hypothetical protein
MNITPESPVRFHSGVAGVECGILVTHYLPHQPAILSGPMEDAVEEVPAEFEFTAYITGTNDVLEVDISDADADRVFDEFEAFLLASKHYKDF